MSTSEPVLTPRLVVSSADEAITYYQRVFDARLIERFADPRRGGQVVHAAIDIRGAVVSLADADEDWGNASPGMLGGSPVLVQVQVDDADAVANAMVEHGGEVIIAVDDRFYGKREGRLRDPFGHLWIVSETLEDLDDAEIRRRMERGTDG